MKTNLIKLSAVTLAIFTLNGCDSFLDEEPSVTTNAPINTAVQLLSLYDNTSHIEEWDYSGAYTTDDYGMPLELFQASPNTFSGDIMCFYALEGDVMASTSSNYLWQREYAKIFDANTIITSASSVSGEQAVKDEALCNAYFMRAWSLFKLATTYCLPYTEANRSALGLPLRLDILFTENIARRTLGETFDQILSDLKASEGLCKQDRVAEGFSWRVSKCALYGFYARLYLYMNQYTEALDYANKAVALAPALKDLNTIEFGTPKDYPATDNRPAESMIESETSSWNLAKILKWDEWVFARLQNNRNQWYCPSQELIDCYEGTDDRRFDLFFVEHGNHRMSVDYDWYRYNQFRDGAYNISGITTAELLLTKAECMARAGQWQQALAVLTPLREARFTTGTATALTAANQQEALKQILEERRREYPFALRLMDIKRFAVNDTAEDDVTISRPFYEVEQTGVDQSKPITVNVKGDSPKLAIPIPVLDIQNSQGAIEQNPFE